MTRSARNQYHRAARQGQCANLQHSAPLCLQQLRPLHQHQPRGLPLHHLRCLGSALPGTSAPACAPPSRQPPMQPPALHTSAGPLPADPLCDTGTPLRSWHYERHANSLPRPSCLPSEERSSRSTDDSAQTFHDTCSRGARSQVSLWFAGSK